jgi:hypothetical protein
MLRRRLAAAALAVTRKAARAEARQARAARAEERRAVRAEARRAAGAPSGAAARGRVGWLVQAAPIVVAVAALGLAAAGWRGGGGPDTLAGEVAVVRAAGGSGGGLVVQEPRVGRSSPCNRWRWGRGCGRPRPGGRWRGRSGRPGCRAGSCWWVWSCRACSCCCFSCGSDPVPVRRPGRVRPRRTGMNPSSPAGGGGWVRRRWPGPWSPSTRCWSAAGGDRDGPGCRARPGGARAGLGGARTAGPALVDLPWRHRSGARSDPPSPTTAWLGWWPR